jgi:hypothetical protein
VDQTTLSWFILRRAPGGVTPRTIPYMTDVYTSDSLGVVRVPYGLNRSPWVENPLYPDDSQSCTIFRVFSMTFLSSQASLSSKKSRKIEDFEETAVLMFLLSL